MELKRIVLGVTGGVAAYKAAELARLLVKQGIDVQVVFDQPQIVKTCPSTARRRQLSPNRVTPAARTACLTCSACACQKSAHVSPR